MFGSGVRDTRLSGDTENVLYKNDIRKICKMTINDKERELIDEFGLFEDWMDKYNYIIELGKGLEKMPVGEKNDENLISGCTSQVWLVSEFKDGKVYFKADSDALIPKGIAALLVGLYSGEKPDEILKHHPVFILETGLQQHLSPNRANGLASMLNKIKSTAGYYQTSIDKL